MGGIAAMKLGNRLVDVSAGDRDVHPSPAQAGGGRYGIIEDYGGHGIGTEMHMDPHLLNYVERSGGRGRSWSPASASRSSRWCRWARRRPVLEDDWTVITTDGTWSSHWEHSVALTEEGPLVLTAPDGAAGLEAGPSSTGRSRAAPDPLGLKAIYVPGGEAFPRIRCFGVA